jgi:predicted deacylase
MQRCGQIGRPRVERGDRILSGSSDSLIASEVDFSAAGKQQGFLRLPHSVHRSAYGWIPVPVVSIKNGTGPRVLLMAGNHGDEYEGQVALSKLVQRLDPARVNGQIILLPMANFPAAKAGLRTSPLDGGNLNRSFPGDPEGTPTQMIAHYIESVLLQGTDYLFDLHSGGSSLHYLPSMLMGMAADEPDRAGKLDLLQAFGLPYALLFTQDRENRFSSSAAARQGAVAISTELGGSGTVTRDILAMVEGALIRVLAHLGVLAADAAPLATPTRIMEVAGEDYYCYATDDGLFEPYVELGDSVSAGQPAGALHTPETPWRAPVEVFFERDGLVLCKRVPGRSRRGDCLFHLASDFSPL